MQQLWKFSGFAAALWVLLCGGGAVQEERIQPPVPPLDIVELIHTEEGLLALRQRDSITQILERALETAEARALAWKIHAAAMLEGIDPVLYGSLVLRESWGDPNAVSWAGAVGLAQVMPRYWQDANPACTGNLFDPSVNLGCGARVLRHYTDQCRGVIRCALNRYWGGHRTYADGPSPYTQRIEDEIALL